MQRCLTTIQPIHQTMSGDGGAAGPLMALVAYGAIDGTMGNNTMKRIKTYKRNEIVNKTNLSSHSIGEVSLTRTHTDIYNLKHIIIINPSENFKIDYVDLIIGVDTILRIYFDFLKCIKKEFMSKIILSEEEMMIVYDIPWHDMGYTDIVKLVALQFHEISFKVVYAGNYQKFIYCRRRYTV